METSISKWPQKRSQSIKNFLGEHAPTPPAVLHAYEVVSQARLTSAREGRVSSLVEVGLACKTTYEVTQAYWHAHLHVNPLLKILATGLFSLPSAVALYVEEDKELENELVLEDS